MFPTGFYFRKRINKTVNKPVKINGVTERWGKRVFRFPPDKISGQITQKAAAALFSDVQVSKVVQRSSGVIQILLLSYSSSSSGSVSS